MADQPKTNQNSIQVKVDPETEQGTYSNAVSVHVNKNEVILDFGYILPNMKPTTIKLVDRVNLSHATAESFMKVLSNAMLDWRNKQKEANNGGGENA
ncbi:MAG: DUF3467 domain-containing protein [Candidatus Gracilibacteria bacterium]|nr:DUF3467 domain-containing protein [Candidatus Peregrinibacteria bacterium]HMR00953.1 DUF3467 domain-containing protein [Candidatus Gracilibacteria bacterium]